MTTAARVLDPITAELVAQDDHIRLRAMKKPKRDACV